MSEYSLIAQITEKAQLHIKTESLNELAQALVFFNLATPNQAPAAAEAPAPAPVAEEPKAKKPKAAKAEAPAATQPAVEAAPVETAAAEPAVESPSEAAPATPAAAAEAVRAYGAKHGIAAARELLQKFGFSKTADITAEKAGEVVAAASV